MTEQELYKKVRESIGITSDAQDKQLFPHFKTCFHYLINAGISRDKLLNKNETLVGLLARGTNDFWMEGKFSDVFYELITSFRTEEGDTSVQTKFNE